MTNYEIVVLSERDPHVPTCFPCFKCNRCMAQKNFFTRDGHKYCRRCFSQTFGLKCALCQNAVEGVSKVNFIFYDNNIWHEWCFKCSKHGDIFNEERLRCGRCGADVTCDKKR